MPPNHYHKCFYSLVLLSIIVSETCFYNIFCGIMNIIIYHCNYTHKKLYVGLFFKISKKAGTLAIYLSGKLNFSCFRCFIRAQQPPVSLREINLLELKKSSGILNLTKIWRVLILGLIAAAEPGFLCIKKVSLHNLKPLVLQKKKNKVKTRMVQK